MQLLGAALMVVPATVSYGAALMFGTMLFSVYAHLAREYQPRQVPWPATLAILALVTGVLYGPLAWGPVGLLFGAI